MKLLDRVSPQEKQSIMDQLHAEGVIPTALAGSGSPAHVASLVNNLNDLRSFAQLESANIHKLFVLSGYRPEMPVPPPPPPKEPKAEE